MANFIQKSLNKLFTSAIGEISADMMMASENPDAGWSVVLDRVGRIIAFRYHCEGRSVGNVKYVTKQYKTLSDSMARYAKLSEKKEKNGLLETDEQKEFDALLRTILEIKKSLSATCNWVSQEILPSVKIHECNCECESKSSKMLYKCEVTCGMCKAYSSLLEWMIEKEMVDAKGLPKFELLPQRYGTSSASRAPQMVRVGPDMSAGDYPYEQEPIASVAWFK